VYSAYVQIDYYIFYKMQLQKYYAIGREWYMFLFFLSCSIYRICTSIGIVFDGDDAKGCTYTTHATHSI